MKKIIAFLLVVVLCVGLLPTAVFADGAQFLYDEEEIQELYYDFEYVSGLVETLFTNEKNLAYWNYAKQKEDQKVASWLIGMSNKILGEEPDKKYYAQLLTNMIAMLEFDMDKRPDYPEIISGLLRLAGEYRTAPVIPRTGGLADWLKRKEK